MIIFVLIRIILLNYKKFGIMFLSHKWCLFLSKENQKKLESLQNQQQQSKKDYDYNSFLLQEIQESQVLNLDLKTLESQYETLSNVDYIQSELQFAQQILSHEDVGVSTQLNELKQRFNKLKDVSSECTALFERILSTQIELEDIFTEIVGKFGSAKADLDKEFIKKKDGSVIADGNSKIRDLNSYMEWNLSEDGSKTINGTIIDHLDQIPQENLCLEIEGYRIEVLKIEENAIGRVKIIKKGS